MPFSNVSMVEVRGKYLLLDGSPASGTVTFEALERIVDDVADEIGFPTRVVVPLVAGAFSTFLAATNDPDAEPAGWSYEVHEQISGSSVSRRYTLTLPHTSTVVDLADASLMSMGMIYDDLTEYDDESTYVGIT